MVIGVTGNSGSGKTLFSRKLADELEAKLIDADDVVKELSKPGQEYYTQIVNEFGKEYVLENGELDRKKIACKIFNDLNARDKINKITFKYIVEEIKNEVETEESITIIDAPLLIESGLNKICDIVIGIVASKKTKIKRICLRDEIDEKLAKQRIDCQPKCKYYELNSDYIIKNDGNNLELQVEKLVKIIKGRIND